VVFSGGSSNLVPGDTNGVDDVFVHDRRTGAIERVSMSSAGVQGNSTNTWGVISADGRFVAFYAKSDNLVPGDTNTASDVFVRDRQLGTTVRVSEDAAGVQGNFGSYASAISADGRYVVFESEADNLVAGDTNGALDIFVKDLLTGGIERVSVATGGGQANGGSRQPAVSADGRLVVFSSDATNLDGLDLNPSSDIYLHDRSTGVTRLVHVDSAGNQGISASTIAGGADSPSISADGSRVSFASGADNLVAGDTNGMTDVFLHDIPSGQTTRVSVSSQGAQGNDSSRGSRLSASGGHVLFESRASNLVANDTNFMVDVFAHDVDTGTTERVSVSDSGQQATDSSSYGDISIDGRHAAFSSAAGNLVPFDTNGTTDAFVRDRGGDPGSIALSGGGLQQTGQPVQLAWSGAPSTGLWWLVYSENLSGVVVQTHPFAVGQPFVILAQGAAASSGNGSFTSGPVPAGAAGKLVHFELAARDQSGALYDSNTVSLQIW
jgi:hypothetical protein